MKGLISRLTIAAVAATALAAIPAAQALPQQQPGYYGYQHRDWDEAMPPHLQQVVQEGFVEGIRGARKDAENHRSWNVNNRDEYRHPHYDGLDREAYRSGFRLGYRFAVERMTGHRWGDDDRR